MKYPLYIFVLHDHDSTQWGEYFDLIERRFKINDTVDTMDFSLHIPVRNISTNKLSSSQKIRDIKSALKLYTNVVIISFADKPLCKNDETAMFLKMCLELTGRKKGLHIIPVASTPDVFKMEKYPLKDLNHIRLFDFKIEIHVNFMLELSHEILCLFLEKGSCDTYPRVKLFISHSKRDGLDIAESFVSFLNQTPLKSFFDKNDIPRGMDFNKSLLEHIKHTNSAFLCINTDSYSTRQVCKEELILAKSYQRPIIFIDMIETVEWSFSYLGNAPVIRWSKNKVSYIVDKLIFEFLRNIIIDKQLHAYRKTIKSSVDQIITHKPDAFTIAILNEKFKRNKKSIFVLYSEVFALDKMELEVLKSIDPRYNFICH